jgi:hypothetical protein
MWGQDRIASDGCRSRRSSTRYWPGIYGPFLARAQDGGDGGRSLPSFVTRELSEFLRCGILAHGFCRMYCEACGKDELVAFSCKHRGICPSCGARRMADLAAHLVDRVIPDLPVRQWVLSLPHRVGFLCACDPILCRGVRRILARAVSGYYLRAARRLGLPRPTAGAVVFEQRFDSALRLNLHFHGLWTDGVFACRLGSFSPEFHPAQGITDRDVARLVRSIRDRVVRFLRKRGKLPADGDPAEEPSLLDTLGAAAVTGRTALGNRAGAADLRLGRGTRQDEFLRGPLCAALDGFSLHAAVRVPEGCRERLEKLCRYVARPPIVEDRLSLLPDGRVLYALKRRFRDGSTHVVFEPLALIERLCALIPRPRRKLVTYHDVFAPAAGYRHRVVPAPPLPREEEHEKPACAHQQSRPSAPQSAPTPSPPQVHARRRRPRSRYSWAELLRRVYLIDVLTCPHCGGRRRLLVAIHDQVAIRRILLHLGLAAEPPLIASARAPPQPLLPW